MKNMYCNSLEELLFNLTNPNPEFIYIFLPKNFKPINEKRILDVFNSERNCIVYSDIEIHHNGKITNEYYPSYNMMYNFPINCPIYINLHSPITVSEANTSDAINAIFKQVFGIHIPEPLFAWHPQGI